MKHSVLIAGLEQSGKTYFCEQVAKAYVAGGKTAVIYNVGKDSDFAGAEICEPLSKETLYRNTRNKTEIAYIKSLGHIPAFRDEKTGKVIPFQFFRQFYAGKMVKIYRAKDERFLFKSFFTYLFDTMIVFDDNRATTRGGLGHELIELCSRKNHAGAKYCESGRQGVDLFFIYHNLDTVPPELYDYITRAVLFSLNRMPEHSRVNNPEFWEIISESVEELKAMPKYSRIELLLRGYPEIKKITHKNT